MVLKRPTSYSAGRKIVMNGQTYQPGDDVPSAVVKGTRRLSALLSRRLLVPNLDPHRRRNRKTTTGPTDVSAVARRDI